MVTSAVMAHGARADARAAAKAAVEASFEDFYEVLNVAPDASDETITKAFRRLARVIHPDQNKDVGAAALFDRVVKGKDLLLDPAKRREFDAKRRAVLRERERWVEADARTRSAKEALDRREAGGAAAVTGRAAAAAAAARDAAEVRRLREEGVRLVAEFMAERRATRAAGAEAVAAAATAEAAAAVAARGPGAAAAVRPHGVPGRTATDAVMGAFEAFEAETLRAAREFRKRPASCLEAPALPPA